MNARLLFPTTAVQSINAFVLGFLISDVFILNHECHRMEYERNEALIGKNDWTARALSPEKYGKAEPYKYEFYVMDQHERQNNWFKRSIFARTVYRPPKIQNYIEWENED